MLHQVPTLTELGIQIPAHLKSKRFEMGFNHALKGGQLDHVEYFRLSFREGFRAAKLYLRELQRKRGVLCFPMKARVRFKAH